MPVSHEQVAAMHRLGYATAAEVAEVLRIAKTNVLRHVRLGHLKGSRYGAGIFIPVASVETYVRSMQPPAPPEMIAEVKRLAQRVKRPS